VDQQSFGNDAESVDGEKEVQIQRFIQRAMAVAVSAR
jgi:hypothetical protein